MADKKESLKDLKEQKIETVVKEQPSVGMSELALALTQAIQAARPEKKNAFNRKVNTPWTPKDGSMKPKLRRKMFQHGLPLDEDVLSPQEIRLMNEVKTGRYMNGDVIVRRRKDRGIDIDYPVKTASQRLRLVNLHGIRNLEELLDRCITEAKTPKSEASQDLED